MRRRFLWLVPAAAGAATLAAVGLAGPGGGTYTNVPAANQKAAGYAPASVLSPELRESPVDRYLLGLLAPRFGVRAERRTAESDDDEPIAADAQPEDPLASGGVKADSGWEGTPEERPPAVEQLVPSAFGLAARRSSTAAARAYCLAPSNA